MAATTYLHASMCANFCGPTDQLTNGVSYRAAGRSLKKKKKILNNAKNESVCGSISHTMNTGCPLQDTEGSAGWAYLERRTPC